jgi:SAM-dependent methyltransferase
VADLQHGEDLPSDAFDCVILTQTLHLIFELPKAIEVLHRILKSGGVLLATVPGVSSVDAGEWGGTWFWSLTPASLDRLLRQRFAAGEVEVAARGNVLTAIAFLHGLAQQELRPADFEVADPQYPVIVTARATKAKHAAAAE